MNTRQDTIKFLEENTDKTFSDINHANVFLGQYPRAKETKTNKLDLLIYKLLHSKGNQTKILQNGRKYLQICNQQGLNLQNIQITPIIQPQKYK